MAGKIAGFVINFAVLLAFFGGLDLLILYLIRKNTNWIKIITAGMLYTAVIFLGLYFAAKYTAGHDIGTYITGEFEAGLQSMVEMQKKAGATDEEIEALRKQYDVLVVRTMPAWGILSALFVVFLNFFVVRLYAFRKFAVTNPVTPFEMWYFDERVAWLTISALAVFAFRDKIPVPWARDASLNVIFVMANLYFMAGLAVLLFLFKKYKVPQVVQFIGIGAVILFNGISIIMILTGVLDTWFNFRKLTKGGITWK
ncbi:MAG: YybS family protein [Spirochaetia bacterium]|nr:YybS family protein [Spirochaetia bacterium]